MTKCRQIVDIRHPTDTQQIYSKESKQTTNRQLTADSRQTDRQHKEETGRQTSKKPADIEQTDRQQRRDTRHCTDSIQTDKKADR